MKGRRLRPFGTTALHAMKLPVGLLLFAVLAAGWLELSLYEFSLPEYLPWRLRPMAANLLLVSGYGALALLLVPRRSAAMSLAGLLIATVGLANARKITELGEPLQAFDVFHLRNAPVLISYLSRREVAYLVVVGTIVVLTVRRSARHRLGSPGMAFLAMLVVAASAVAASLSSPSGSWAKRAFDTYDYYWDPLENHRSNGFAVASLLYLAQMTVAVPNRYEAGVEREMLQNFLPCDPPQYDSPRRQHVVVAMLESFWDPTADGLAFDRDPLPFYRGLRSRGTVQSFVSPVFGGGTANAEFEVLTGLSTRFSPAGSIPYQQYLKRPVESVASVFRQNGYRTVAVHNFRRHFWNRDVVYPHLGFDEYVSLEDLQDISWELGWPTDAAVFDRVERILAEADRPTFVFAVTVATHGPYTGRGLLPTVQLIDPEQPELVGPMSVYASKLELLDKHLARFVSGLDLLPEPPVVVVFADHLPTVAAAALPTDNGADIPRSRLVEGLVLGAGNAVPGDGPRSLNCLGPEILRLGGVPPPPFFRFVEDVCSRMPVITRFRMIEDEEDEVLDRYRWLSYDRLFGAGYSSGVCNAT